MKTAPKIVAAGLAAAAVLLTYSEGIKHFPYKDAGGVLTVCEGITGPDVIEGKWYSTDECAALKKKHLELTWAKIEPCFTRPLALGEVASFAHFAYNVGPSAFCASTLVKKFNAGDRTGACGEVRRWRYVRIDGLLRDCAHPDWKRKCGGLVERRVLEESVCANTP